jgi:WD40 repeat protein
LWDTETGELKKTFTGHKGIISSVAFSPNGRTLATASHDGSLFLRDAQTGVVTQSLSGHTGYVLSVAFSSDGKTLASAGGVERQVAEVRLWDARTGRLKDRLGGHSDLVLWVAFSPDKTTLGSGSYGEILLTEIAAEEVMRELTKTEWSMVGFGFSPDGTLLASGGWAFPKGEGGQPDYRQAIGGIQLWETGTGRLKVSFTAHERQLTSISYSPDGRMLASGSSDGTVKLWAIERLLKGEGGE